MSDTDDENPYHNGKIYSLVLNSTDLPIYVGSTIRTLDQRLSGHKTCMLNLKISRELYDFIYQNGGFDNISIILLENFPCNSNKELRLREQFYIDRYGDILFNSVSASGNTKQKAKDYYKKNQEKLKNLQQIYNRKNKQHISKNKQQYYKQNRTKLLNYAKEYREKKKAEKKSEDKEKNTDT
jgi:hypothetical protein